MFDFLVGLLEAVLAGALDLFLAFLDWVVDLAGLGSFASTVSSLANAFPFVRDQVAYLMGWFASWSLIASTLKALISFLLIALVFRGIWWAVHKFWGSSG